MLCNLRLLGARQKRGKQLKVIKSGDSHFLTYHHTYSHSLRACSPSLPHKISARALTPFCIFLGRTDCSLPCRLFSSIPGLYSVDIGTTLLSEVLTTENISRMTKYFLRKIIPCWGSLFSLSVQFAHHHWLCSLSHLRGLSSSLGHFLACGWIAVHWGVLCVTTLLYIFCSQKQEVNSGNDLPILLLQQFPDCPEWHLYWLHLQ